MKFSPRPSYSSSLPRPGTAVRIPVGIFFVSLVVFTGVVVLAYLVGYTRGGNDREMKLAKLAAEAAKAAAVTRADPVAIEPGAVLPGESNTHPTPRTTTQRSVSSRPAEAAGRKVGLNYFVLATYLKEDADRLTAFLATKGVEAATISTHNRRLFQVVDLRGFTAMDVNSPVFEERRRQLRQLGREWKEKAKGPDDLKDIWAEKYTGG